MNAGETNECGQRITNEAKIKRKKNTESYQNQTGSRCKETLRKTKGTKDRSHGKGRKEKYPKENPGTG